MTPYYGECANFVNRRAALDASQTLAKSLASDIQLQPIGPLAQLAERLVDVEEVTGSSPVQPTDAQ